MKTDKGIKNFYLGEKPGWVGNSAVRIRTQHYLQTRVVTKKKGIEKSSILVPG